jgi:ABC-type dipeptide/oligopeptide/nickel transport system permease subunit
MLGSMHEFHWSLVIVPGIALVLAVVGFTIARKPLPEKAFSELKAQLDADAKALRAVGAHS